MSEQVLVEELHIFYKAHGKPFSIKTLQELNGNLEYQIRKISNANNFTSIREFFEKHNICWMLVKEPNRWNDKKVINKIKELYKKNGDSPLTYTQLKNKGYEGMYKWILTNLSEKLGDFLKYHKMDYMLEGSILQTGKRPKSKKYRDQTDIDSLKQELINFFNEYGKFNTSILQKHDSGLERFIRLHYSGLRDFCKKYNLDYILQEPKVIKWTIETAVEKLKQVYEKHNRINTTILANEKLNKLYQWISKHSGDFRTFLINNNLDYMISNENIFWSDAKCFQLIKNMFVQNKGKLYPEQIKKTNKGAYNYIYEKHDSFENFVLVFDLQEYVVIRKPYTDKTASEKIKEVYYKLGEKVYVSLLVKNGYSGLVRYIADKGDGSFFNGAMSLGLSEFVTKKSTSWNEEIALETVKEMLLKKGEPLISSDFEKNQLTGLRDWITAKYSNLESFFNNNNMPDQFVNMKYVSQELWAYGIRFQELAKEAVEIMYEKHKVKYDTWVEHLKVRPDFQIDDTGHWIDAKLSTIAYFSASAQIEKYISHEQCNQLTLLCLDSDNGRIFSVDYPNVDIILIEEWYFYLYGKGAYDLVDKIETLRFEVSEVRKIKYN
ncbi:hypothetical protein ACIG6B_07295 [Bacillus mobilis]|uniref:hypothetical protein n=1 Tax=Bacillus mobilis TaxID=2026190 RepID=UPI00363820BC